MCRDYRILPANLEDGMRVYVLLAEGFEEIEALTPVDYLRRVGVEVLTLSCGQSLSVCGAHKISVVADMMVDEALNCDASVDGVVVPGGMPGAANIGQCVAAGKLICSMMREGKVVAALCAAPVVALARLGVLKGRKFTCYPSMELQIEKWGGEGWQEAVAGSLYTGNRVEVDGNLFTAAGPGTAEEFSLILAREFAGEQAAAQLAASALFR